MDVIGSNYDEASSSRRRNALVHLASIDPIELCNEAKVESCRAARDLRSCGRYVQRVLISCGHAALCEECSQRCDVCPICRIPLPKGSSNVLPLRLYYECIEAGLISKNCDDRLQDKELGENQSIVDVQRLYFLFDVALENNLASLICHYVTDVCMDESAVSSDPVIAFLLDGKVVKDWCRRTFKNILTELQTIYKLTVKEMEGRLRSLLKTFSKLAGMAKVLEVLESSFASSVNPLTLEDLNHLQESILKTKQHLEIMMWCIRHQFLEHIRSRHSNISSWRSSVRERKAAAIKRAWPDSVNHKVEFHDGTASSLFIEEALSNLDVDQGHLGNDEGEIAISSFLSEGGNSNIFARSKLHGMARSYPFESLRSAVDLLFLQGNSDLVVAKQAILLYFLFDRHWTMPAEEWKYIVDDFAATFSISRHYLLESFSFYLLDDHTEEALKEASRLLPEISVPSIHPKIAQSLLERHDPDSALMTLRWSGQDVGATTIGEAITAVRVRIECGLLTEAFMYQRMIVKDKKKQVDDFDWVEVLVTEICCLCIRRNLVDRMIELSWNKEEEKHIHKCLLDFAMHEPISTVGSLLVVFYLQRYRYIEAYQVDRKLQVMEEDFISQRQNEEISYKISTMSHWRKGLVDQSVVLLPDVIQQQIKSGNLPEVAVSNPTKFDVSNVEEPFLSNLLLKVPQLQQL